MLNVEASLMAKEMAVLLDQHLGERCQSEDPVEDGEGAVINADIVISNDDVMASFEHISKTYLSPAVDDLVSQIGSRRVFLDPGMPDGAVKGSVIKYCGLAIRVLPIHDGISDALRYRATVKVKPV